MTCISFDSRSLIIEGKRKFIISGEIHYARVPRSEWSRLLDTTKASGVNCVATYIFWNVHEPERGVYNFSGQADLGAFLTLCREKGLEVILRMGPYCCAEWNYGGYPFWLR
ncbi:MAG: beta-galactosidase, partial [Methylacidiphilales bacterium]|nr:beta-galactosidase [Candidatus Methylacidiphilales bacterium]